MPESRHDPIRGLLNLHLAEGRVQVARYLPSERLGGLVEHYWSVRWDMAGGEPFTSETLPYPSVHLTLEGGEWRLTGVPTRRFERTLTGVGMVFGVKFRPGGFRPVLGSSVAAVTDRVLAAAELLPALVNQLETDETRSDAWWFEHVERALGAHVPRETDPRVDQVAGLVDAIAADRGVVRVEQIVALADMSQRALQRLFREYVGVSPKWVIQRYRLFEAADRLAACETDGAQVAQELGYFDQAHFISDFKALVGASPGAYAAARHVA